RDVPPSHQTEVDDPQQSSCGARDQSGLMPANFITLAHFSVSVTMSLPNSVGEPASTVLPMSAIRAFMMGLARAALISLFSLSITSGGVFLRAPIPDTTLAS